MKRRDFITLLGASAAARPVAARAQQGALPVIGFVSGQTPEVGAGSAAAFRKGLAETGYIEGQNVMVEYHWLEGQFGKVPALVSDLVGRRVAIIAAPAAGTTAVAAKAATATIPIIFSTGDDPVKLGLVASLARPGGNVTGVNFLNVEVVAKRLAILHELVPKAMRIAVLLNPADPAGRETTLQQIEEAAGALGLRVSVLDATTSDEIDTAFAALARERAEALFISGGALFTNRRVQLANLAARERIAATSGTREFVAAGGLMSYGADVADSFRQVGIYAGRVLRGAKPADLPVMQPTKLELVINKQTAKLLGIEVPPTLLAIADEVIE